MKFIDILEIILRFIEFALADKDKQEKLKLQMYEFARKFNKTAVDSNFKHRHEYRNLRRRLKEKVKME